jgi:membrane dipeptidase
MKKLMIWLGIVLVVILVSFFLILPIAVERGANRTLKKQPFNPTEKTRALHKSLFIADLHADSLLWSRNLLKRSNRGHVDIPRLIEGNVALQVFTIVTKVPRGLNLESNNSNTDYITPLVIAQGLPVSTWSSLKERAVYQAKQLHQFSSASNGKFYLIKSSKDLSLYLEQRKRNTSITAGLLGIEGAHALEGDLNNLDLLFDAGIRMISPTHFFDNEAGGSAHGIGKGGLTSFGKELIKRMEAKGIILDLAHSSEQVFIDALTISNRPVLVSHTGVKGTCNNRRNLSDEQLKAVAKTGGIVGIGYWDTAVCGKDTEAIAKAIRYTVDLIGIEHVALGSDFDGAVSVPYDAANLIAITDALIAEGFNEQEIKLVMGENVLRLLLKTLS